MKNGDKVRITDSRGRDLKGTVRIFEQDGEKRYELVKVTERQRQVDEASGKEHFITRHYDAVGFDPENYTASTEA